MLVNRNVSYVILKLPCPNTGSAKNIGHCCNFWCAQAYRTPFRGEYVALYLHVQIIITENHPHELDYTQYILYQNSMYT
jgi:hypothetical protein